MKAFINIAAAVCVVAILAPVAFWTIVAVGVCLPALGLAAATAFAVVSLTK